MTRPIWHYYFARKFSTSRFDVVMRVFISDYYKRHFNARLAHMLVAPVHGNHAIYYVESEWRRFASNVYRGACKDYRTFKQYVASIKRTQVASYRIARSIAAKPLASLSWDKLGAQWRRWDRAHLEHFLKPIWIPFIIEPLLSQAAERILQRRSPRDHEKSIDAVFSPEYPNAITREHIDLLRLALRVKKGVTTGQRNAALHAATARYAFIPCYDVIDTPWNTAHFATELEKLLRQDAALLARELRSVKAQYPKARREFRALLNRLTLTKRERDVLKMAHDIIFIKDERDDFRRLHSFTIQPLFRELARRARLPFRAPLYLTSHEMRQWFTTGTLPIPRSILTERMKGYSLHYASGAPLEIRSGQAMRSFLATQRFAHAATKGITVKGAIGNRGLARGRVAIVRTVHDLRRVRHGDILVAVTTNPDYVPAMRKSKAIVTDEGGITSHAAIVARELNIPCVVGTKTATKILNNGDRVEVDATKGTVRKLS